MIHQELGERERERERERGGGEFCAVIPFNYSLILSRRNRLLSFSYLVCWRFNPILFPLKQLFFLFFLIQFCHRLFPKEEEERRRKRENREREKREICGRERERGREKREKREREKERSVRLISEKLCAEPAAFTALAQQSEQTSKRRRRRRRRPREPALVLSHPHTTLPFFRDRREESFARPLLLRERTRLLFPRHRRLPRATREAFFPAQEEPAEHP